jgi:hypothetical protein
MIRGDDEMCREVYSLLLLMSGGLIFFSRAALLAPLHAIADVTGVNGT